MRGIDTDNYDGDIPVAHFQRLHDVYGVRFNIIGLEAMEPYAASQAANSLAAGIAVPLHYKFLYWRDDDLERMKRASGFGRPVAIDCETGNGMPGGPAATVERILQARDVLKAEGQYWGIYTGQWWWPENTGNSQAFASDPLWHAAYPFGGGNLPPQLYIPTDFSVGYGGWTRATVFQYADTCYEDASWHLDLNAWNPAVPFPGAQTEDDMLTRHNENAAWFDNRDVGPTNAGDYYVMQARSDWKLPEGNLEVVFQQWSKGHVRWFDGQSESEAGAVGSRGEEHGIVSAVLGADGTLNFRAESDVHFDTLACLGYRVRP